ncbi:MAG TPA: hypothetical protein VGO06_01660 [Bosea sp. (in: a-proteobacteria)]|jgi:hypothetical protein|uniref:hypothetical protein n=1 Tax=Bosea sp. (in: a-proteobacteria) TaxID=1871050 RepID=UPI002E0FDB5E|nr:hypothetical protein [Bosea sp. (in: a-proteobacteria)]
MSKTGAKSPSRAAPAISRPAAGTRAPRSDGPPREVFGRFFETLGRLDGGSRSGKEGAR